MLTAYNILYQLYIQAFCVLWYNMSLFTQTYLTFDSAALGNIINQSEACHTTRRKTTLNCQWASRNNQMLTKPGDIILPILDLSQVHRGKASNTALQNKNKSLNRV